MQLAKIQSISFRPNRARVEVLSVVAEIRAGQNVTAEYINPPGEFSTPVVGDWALVARRGQTSGKYLAFGAVDIINAIQADRGVKILLGRAASGEAGAKITLTDSDLFIETPGAAVIALSEDVICLNDGEGIAVEHGRLQSAFDDYTQTVLLPEFKKVAAGTEPNPAAPYVPSPDLPINIESAKSETIKVP